MAEKEVERVTAQQAQWIRENANACPRCKEPMGPSTFLHRGALKASDRFFYCRRCGQTYLL